MKYIYQSNYIFACPTCIGYYHIRYYHIGFHRWGFEMNNVNIKKDYDAIIIGAGVIGSAIGFELSKKGWKTLNVDRNPTSGYGSTAASCAIIRVHYSTFDGCA